MLKFLRRVFFRAVEAEKVKERVRKSVVYEEEVVDMSDASLNVADRKELYDFFVQAKVKKGKLITRSETLDELRQFSGGLVGGCFEEVEMKYSGRLRLLSARVVKLLEGVRKGVVFGEKSLLIISFGQHLYFPFRFIAIQLVKVGSYCVNLDIKSSKLLKLLCFDDFCSKEKFPNNRSTDDFFQYLSRLHYGELTIVTILMLMFCYLIEFVRVNKLRVIHNIPIFSDLQKRLGEGFIVI